MSYDFDLISASFKENAMLMDIATSHMDLIIKRKKRLLYKRKFQGKM